MASWCTPRGAGAKTVKRVQGSQADALRAFYAFPGAGDELPWPAFGIVRGRELALVVPGTRPLVQLAVRNLD